MHTSYDNAIIGRVYDDLGKVHRLFLWNGKPISKTRWIKKVLAEGIPLPDLEKRISPEANPTSKDPKNDTNPSNPS